MLYVWFDGTEVKTHATLSVPNNGTIWTSLGHVFVWPLFNTVCPLGKWCPLVKLDGRQAGFPSAILGNLLERTENPLPKDVGVGRVSVWVVRMPVSHNRGHERKSCSWLQIEDPCSSRTKEYLWWPVIHFPASWWGFHLRVSPCWALVATSITEVNNWILILLV